MTATPLATRTTVVPVTRTETGLLQAAAADDGRLTLTATTKPAIRGPTRREQDRHAIGCRRSQADGTGNGMDHERRAFVTALAASAVSAATGRADDFDPRTLIAPIGTLRVGVYPGSPTSPVRDSPGDAHGVTVELGRALAQRLGVPFAMAEHPRIAAVLAALKTGAIDLTISNATPLRAQSVDFAETLLALELGYLVPAGSPVRTPDGLRESGRRIGVTMGGTSERTLGRRMPEAIIVPVPTLQETVERLHDGRLDAYATNKSVLYQMSDALPGSRVLDGRWGLERLAFALPKGREAALATLRDFTREVRTDGLLDAAVRHSGLRGVATDVGPEDAE